MAAIIFTDMDKDSFAEDGECVFDIAASLAEDLYDHVVSGSHGPSEETTWMAPTEPPGKGN